LEAIIGAQLDTDSDTIFVKSFATLVVRIMAMEEKVIGDGLLINQQNHQMLVSSGVAATLTYMELADTLTTP
jgi:hypothetical protein